MTLPHLLLLLAIGVGHSAMIVVAVNVTHGVGFRAKGLELATLIVLGVLGVVTCGAIWWAWEPPLPEWPLLPRIYAAICLIIALGVLPALTLWRNLRKSPARLSIRSSEVRGPLTTDFSPSRLLRLPGNESLDLMVREVDLAIPGLPLGLVGLRIVHLTDLHMGPAFPRSYFESVAAQAANLEGDLVLCTGDVVEHPSAIPWVETILGTIPARLGRFAVLGNHDYHDDHEPILRAIESAGFTDLDGRWQVVRAGDGRIALGGTAAPWGAELDPKAAPIADLQIVLSHTPDRFPGLARAGTIDLVLSGHNHGGQVRLPLLGPILMPSVYSRRFDRGGFQIGRTLMYVGQGIGAKHPIRYGCPPEVTRFRLVLAPAPDAPPVRTRATSARRGSLAQPA